MNKYEKLFSEICEKTNSGEIEWKQINKRSHSDVIFNPDMAFRQYSGELIKDGETYDVVFVEKKADDPAHDFVYQKYMPEVIVLDKNNELMVTLTDSVIEKDQLIDLVNIIEEKNDKTNKLFK